MRPLPRWSEVRRRARDLADHGRAGLRRARARVGSFAGAGGTRRPAVAPAALAVGADGAAVLAAHPSVHRGWAWAAGILGVLILAIVILIAIWDWDWFRGPVSGWASTQSHHPVAIDGHIKVHLLTWTPQATVTDVRVANPAWAGAGNLATLKRFVVSVRLPALLRGRVELPLVEIDQPNLKLLSDAKGRANWRTGPDNGPPLKLPPMQHLIIRDGHLVLDDLHRKLHLVGQVQSQEDAPGSGRGTFQLTGDGTLNREPFTLRITGGPLIDVRRDRPYQFDARMNAGPTHLAAVGAIDRPFDFGRFHTRLMGSGPDLADLYKITGVTFPNTPPYSTTGQFSRDGTRFSYDHFTGRVGDSDLSGALVVDKVNGRRFLKGDLVSRSLDWKDLAQVLGAAPRASKGASPEQKAVAHTMAAQGRLLPDAPLYADRLRAMDADVRFRATSVKANLVHLTAVKLGLKLNRGVLNIDPLNFSFGQGDLAGRVKIDGRGAVPMTDADLHLSNYALQNLLTAHGGAATASGLLDGQAHLHGAGLSVHEAAAHAGGTVSFSAPHGEIRQAFAELLGVNVGRGLSLLMAKNPRQTNLRCAVADFDVNSGVMHARNIVIDTDVVVSRGEGSINLGTEQIDLKLKGHSKKPRLLRLWTPITVRGSLSHPKLGVEKSSIAAQGGAGLIAGAVINPLAAILPFISLGGAKDVDCAALLARRPFASNPVH